MSLPRMVCTCCGTLPAAFMPLSRWSCRPREICEQTDPKKRSLRPSHSWRSQPNPTDRETSLRGTADCHGVQLGDLHALGKHARLLGDLHSGCADRHAGAVHPLRL